MYKFSESSSPSRQQSECTFCYSPSEQARLLLRGCLQRLRKMLQLKKYSEMQVADVPSGETAPSIHRLIRVLFYKQQFEMIFSKGCAHVRLRNLFRDHLKCRSEQLNSAIQELCDKLARRNYELEIIACQIKNVENSVTEFQDSVAEGGKWPRDSKSSQEEAPRLSSPEAEVKVEEIDQKPIEASPPTAANYNLTFENLPLACNILFYGQPFYH